VPLYVKDTVPPPAANAQNATTGYRAGSSTDPAVQSNAQNQMVLPPGSMVHFGGPCTGYSTASSSQGYNHLAQTVARRQSAAEMDAAQGGNDDEILMTLRAWVREW
jgi:hypothetical protein